MTGHGSLVGLYGLGSKFCIREMMKGGFSKERGVPKEKFVLYHGPQYRDWWLGFFLLISGQAMHLRIGRGKVHDTLKEKQNLQSSLHCCVAMKSRFDFLLQFAAFGRTVCICVLVLVSSRRATRPTKDLYFIDRHLFPLCLPACLYACQLKANCLRTNPRPRHRIVYHTKGAPHHAKRVLRRRGASPALPAKLPQRIALDPALPRRGTKLS